MEKEFMPDTGQNVTLRNLPQAKMKSRTSVCATTSFRTMQWTWRCVAAAHPREVVVKLQRLIVLAELHPVPGNVASAPLTAPSLLQLPSVRLPCQSSLSVVPRGQYIVREAGDSFRRKLCKATQADTIFLMFSSLALKGRRRIRHFLASIPKAFSTNLRALLNL